MSVVALVIEMSLAGLFCGVGPPPAIPQPSAKSFAPGVRIDWQRRIVEVDGVVVRREGMLELLACSKDTREHESVICIDGRPLHVYQALGLVGLVHGVPPTWDPKQQQTIPAQGPAVRLSVRYERQGSEYLDPAHLWLWDEDRNQPSRPLTWVFSGSVKAPQGAFMADVEGTVICVVDFDAALISLPNSHSADNDVLWLSPNPQRVPPLGTACTLLIEALPQSQRTVYLDRHGRIGYRGTVWGYVQFGDAMRSEMAAHEDLQVEVRHSEQAWPADLAALREVLLKAGLKSPQIHFSGQTDADHIHHPASLVTLQTHEAVEVIQEWARRLWLELGGAPQEISAPDGMLQTEMKVLQRRATGLEAIAGSLRESQDLNSDDGTGTLEDQQSP